MRLREQGIKLCQPSRFQQLELTQERPFRCGLDSIVVDILPMVSSGNVLRWIHIRYERCEDGKKFYYGMRNKWEIHTWRNSWISKHSVMPTISSLPHHFKKRKKRTNHWGVVLALLTWYELFCTCFGIYFELKNCENKRPRSRNADLLLIGQFNYRNTVVKSEVKYYLDQQWKWMTSVINVNWGHTWYRFLSSKIYFHIFLYGLFWVFYWKFLTDCFFKRNRDIKKRSFMICWK